MLQKTAFAFMLMLFSSSLFAQGYVKGVISDASTNETLIGANVILKGTTTGVSTDLDGNFNLELPAGNQTLVIQYVGYASKEVAVNVKNGETLELGNVSLASNQIGLDEVSVFASIAVDRKTPVAISSIDPVQIEEKLGTQEFPEVLKATPGVYATKRGGGFGDSRINLRGFNSPNVAVMINGVPVNDMEWGGVYWSNWAGLSDVTRTMQVQRGLGASKVAVPSVGGSINIVTKTTDIKKGGSVYTSIGNDGYLKNSFTVSTGKMDNGWAITMLGARTTGDGYILGTEFEGYSYFLNVSKELNSKQQISFTAFGAPQWHNQRSTYDAKTIAEWQTYKEGYRFNATYGFDINGQRKTSAKNYYHKPQFSLNHFWTISSKSSLSTALYGSYGTGGGATALGTSNSLLYGSSPYRTIEGYLDYARIQRENAEEVNGSKAVIGSSNNNHQWYGAISTFTTKIKNIDLYAGIDTRYYVGFHNKTITDLMGGSFYIDPTRAKVSYMANNYAFVHEKLQTGDVVARDYNGYVLYAGAFAQAEYNKDKLSVFVSGSGSTTTYWRRDNMYAAPGQEKSDKISFPGYVIKGGANYNVSGNHNVFANVGYFSRAPYFSSVFLAKDVSNAINNDAVNENVFSTELGYGYRAKYAKVNLNVYRTHWKNKSLSGSIDSQDPNRGRYNAQGVNAIHQGIELDFVLNPTKRLRLTGMLSLGDWKWEKDVTAIAFNVDGFPVNSKGEIVSLEDAYHLTLDIGGVHVADAAQTTAAFGINYDLFEKVMRIGLDYNYAANLYANYGNIQYLKGSDTWKVPAYGVLDFNTSFNFEIAGLKSRLSAKVNNVLDTEYIMDANNGSSGTWTDARVFYGFGRTYSIALKIRF